MAEFYTLVSIVSHTVKRMFLHDSSSLNLAWIADKSLGLVNGCGYKFISVFNTILFATHIKF
jgi:hypothetical protein